jgi:xanthine phosphoribosyltransferase
LHRDARALAWRLADLGPFKGLVAITRGGLVPAAIIARELNLRLIDTVCCSTYDRMARGAKVELLKGTSAEQEKGKGWLIVDDLVDTGVTARAVRALLPEADLVLVVAMANKISATLARRTADTLDQLQRKAREIGLWWGGLLSALRVRCTRN